MVHLLSYPISLCEQVVQVIKHLVHGIGTCLMARQSILVSTRSYSRRKNQLVLSLSTCHLPRATWKCRRRVSILRRTFQNLQVGKIVHSRIPGGLAHTHFLWDVYTKSTYGILSTVRQGSNLVPSLAMKCPNKFSSVAAVADDPGSIENKIRFDAPLTKNMRHKRFLLGEISI